MESTSQHYSGIRKNLDDKLITYAKKGEFKSVKDMLNQGADVNTIEKPGGHTVLHYAAIYKNIDMVNHLMKLPNIKIARLDDSSGYTPFHLAIIHNSLPVAVALQMYDSTFLTTKDSTGKSPLHLASKAVCNLKSTFMWLMSMGVNRNEIDSWNRTPLMWAIADRNDEKARQLLQYGANFSDLTPQSAVMNPLKLAITTCNASLVHLLIDRGARVEFALPIFLPTFLEGTYNGHEFSIFASKNLATVALQNVSLSRISSIEIAGMILGATSSPPSVESMFEFYGRCILKKSVGQRLSIRKEIKTGIYYKMTHEVKEKLVQLLCLAIGCCGNKITDKEFLRKRFSWRLEAFDNFVKICEDITEERLRAIELRKCFLVGGFGNVTIGMRSTTQTAECRALIKMGWAVDKYKTKLRP